MLLNYLIAIYDLWLETAQQFLAKNKLKITLQSVLKVCGTWAKQHAVFLQNQAPGRNLNLAPGENK